MSGMAPMMKALVVAYRDANPTVDKELQHLRDTTGIEYARRLVKQHLPETCNEPANVRLQKHYAVGRLPHVSVLAKMPTYDRAAVIAYYRFRFAQEMANIQTGHSDTRTYGSAKAHLKSLLGRMKRLESVERAFAEAA